MHYNWKPYHLDKKAIREAFRFHAQWSACWVGHNAQSALALARAELRAKELALRFIWDWDDSADTSFVEGWPAKEQAAWNAVDHYTESCRCIEPKKPRYPLASLGGILDASAEYRRTIEAQLALEAIGEFDESENLDGMWEDDLAAYAADGSHPEALREYAAIKACAMQARGEGKITFALLLEKMLERLYKSLPVHLRW